MSDGNDEEQRWCEPHQKHHPLSAFYRIRDPASAGGYRYRCKELTKKKNADTLKAAPEGSRLRTSQRKAKAKWAHEHPENARTNSANYRARRRKAEEVKQTDQVDQGEARPGHLGEQLDQAEG